MSLSIDRVGWSPLSSPAPRVWLGALEGSDLASLSADERWWGHGLPAQQRHRYHHSRAALRQQLARVLCCEPGAVPLHSPPGQPPRLAAGLGWISLSHSGDALMIGYSTEPIGVDVEARDRHVDAAALLRRFYPVAEQEQLRMLAGERLRQAVLTSWVLKEAAIKWRQRSLAAELRHWCLNHANGLLHHLGDGVQPECCTGLLGRWRWAAVGPGCRSGLRVEGFA